MNKELILAVIRNATIGDIISYVARLYHADVLMCECTVWVESRFNWLAIGDDGTSGGLFQDHIGGELGNHPLSYALNPLNSCLLSISELAACEHQHPNWPVGRVAAAAQRPANQSIYAELVQAAYDAVNSGKPPAGYLTARNKHTTLTIPV